MSDNTVRTKKWFIRIFALLLVLFMLPFAVVGVISFFLPSVYEDTFVGELSEKYERLSKTDDPKIVVIGGSSVAFGLDSGMMEKQLGMKVVNFGLYADLGTKLMMDLSKANINKGDIVVLTPELNSQTLSLYFNAKTALQAMDGNWKMLKNVGTDDYEAIIGGLWTFAGNKIRYLVTGTRPENDGAYKKEYFNEYGDNTFDRPYNVMTEIQNHISFDFRTDYSDTLTTDYEAYIDYVNDYVKYCSRKGATCFFSFCPMNKTAVDADENDDTIYAFYNALRNDLDCKIISNINNYILDEGYFFDSEFHLNNSGVVVRTVRLIDDLKRELGITTLTMREEDLPAPSGFKPENTILVLESNENEDGWIITGLTKEGLGCSEIVIPATVTGIPVTEIASGAFNGANKLVTLELGKNISKIGDSAFIGAHNLGKVIFAEGVGADDIEISEGLLGGANQSIELVVDEAKYNRFLDSTVWSSFKDKIKSEVKSDFEYTVLEENGAQYLAVTGLTAAGKTKDVLTVPDEYDGKPVKVLKNVASDALKTLRLGKNVTAIEEKALAGAPAIEKLILPSTATAENFALPVTLFESSVPEGFKVMVYWENYDKFVFTGDLAVYNDLIDTDNKTLKLERVDDYSSSYWKVTGVLDSAKNEKVLTIPDEVDGLAVCGITSKAFEGSTVEKLYFGKNMTSVQELGFSGAEHLTEVYLPLGMAPEVISVPNAMSEHLMTEGANKNIRFFVDPNYVERFKSDYFWSSYGGIIYPNEAN